MADADRDSDLGDDSPVSARSEGESSGEQSCESSDEGVGRDAPAHQPIQQHQHQPHQPMHQPMQPQHISHHNTVAHQQLNLSHHQQRNSPRPLERELKIRDDFESLKSSLHPHLSSLASLAQGAPLSTPSSVFALAGGGASGGFPYAPPAFLAPAPPPPAQPVGSASSSSSEGSAAGWSFEEQYKQVRQLYEISDDPQRKEFLDDLFSFMQKRGNWARTDIKKLWQQVALELNAWGCARDVAGWQHLPRPSPGPSQPVAPSYLPSPQPAMVDLPLPTVYMEFPCPQLEIPCEGGSPCLAASPLLPIVETPAHPERSTEPRPAPRRHRRPARPSRGTPINRLPIMAKSVLDLYELYNLVIARGGLVEVINKKLWQEIIKGLRLPSSITSAAFTLRTQYMKYLYDYECEKKNLSTRSELDAAIEGNKREGRRASGQYDAQAALAMPPLNRGVPASLAQLSQHMQPLSLSLGGGVGGVPRLPPLPPHAPHISQHDIEYRVREYMKMIQTQRELMRNGSESPPSATNGPATMMSPRDAAALSAIDVSRLTLWSLYNNNNNSPAPTDLEPQREALNLSESPNSSTSVKREACRSPPPPAKRRTPRPPSPRAASPPRHACAPPPQLNGAPNGVNGAAFKITTRGDANTGDQQLVVSIELNGVTYEGVLFPSQNSNGQNSHRQMVS